MNKVKEKLFIIFFLTIIIGLFLLNAILPKREFLYFENRSTNKRPALTKESVMDGEYFNELEEYLVDTFKGRNQFLKIETYMDLNLFKRPIVHDLYIGKDNILTKWVDWGEPYPTKNILEMGNGYGNLSDRLRDRGAFFLYVGIPEHSSIFANEYPDGMFNKGECWLDIENDFFGLLDKNNVLNIRARDFLNKNPKKFYNKTDHHFSYYGAVETYKNIIEVINNQLGYSLVCDDLELIRLKEPFKGSYSRKLFNLDKFEDEALIYKEDFKYSRKDNGENVENKIFHLEDSNQDGYQGYSMYMGGDIPWTEIKTDRKELPNILIYGDSFTNPLETLLLRNAGTLLSVDFRYYKEKDLLEIVDEYQPDVVICVRDNLSYVQKEGNGTLK